MNKLPPAPFLYAITDREMAGESDIEKLVEDLCLGGANVIQLREKNISKVEYIELAKKATITAHRHNALMIINDFADVALYSDADGVHLGEDDTDAREARELLGNEAIIGVSCHCQDSVIAAANSPIDYFAVGPVYPTNTKELKYEIVGTDLITQVRALCDLPLVAIGGISRERANDVIAAGADSVSVIGALMVPGKVTEKTAEFIDSLEK